MEQPFSAEYIEELSHKYKNGRLNALEREDFELWYNDFDDTEFVHSGASNPSAVKARMYSQLLQQIDQKRPNAVARLGFSYIRIAVAAAILIFTSLGFYLYVRHEKTQTTNTFAGIHDILPGSNKAILTLSNGKKIILTGARNGQLAVQAGSIINKTSDGKLVYHDESKNGPVSLAYNTISTPRGGQFQVDLPDGTRVWLNAASSIRYPVSFVNLKERKIELTGEAYFEVKHNSRQPFKVQTPGQLVEDIGTEFNINSYDDEVVIKTTLITGSAAVTPSGGQAKVLTLNQEATLKKSGLITVKAADVEEAVSWKNGEFIFRNSDFRTVMRKLARWYDVDLIYDSSAPSDIPIGGMIPRSKNISELLKLMEETGTVHFKIDGRRIIISK